MAHALADKTARDTFLAKCRLGILITSRPDGSPIGVPVWFEWADEQIRMFADKTSHKVKRLEGNPSANLLVTNQVGEAEAWIAFDGLVEITDSGAFELAERLAHRYWDMSDSARIDELGVWREYADGFCLLSLRPTKIRTGS